MRTRAVLVVLGLALALVVTTAPDAAHADASLANWTGDVCSGVAYVFGALSRSPEPDPAGEQLAVRRYVSNLVQDAHAWMLHTVKYPPPISGGRKLRARIERAMNGAVDEFERAGKILAAPELSPAVVRAAERHLGTGYDTLVTTMRRLRGHSGNARFDAAMTKNASCDYITSLRLVRSGAAT
jgi:hypothetical protein